jgi:hypothetical protein
VGRLVSIDPGNDTGWSVWDDARLTSCGLCHVRDYPALPFLIGLPIDDLVVELPKDYGGNRAVDPNNLISLGYKVGAIIATFCAYHHLMDHEFVHEAVHPTSWKGQVPKHIHHDRHLPKLDAAEKSILLSVLERTPKGKRHDVKDAVCLGLWRIGR